MALLSFQFATHRQTGTHMPPKIHQYFILHYNLVNLVTVPQLVVSWVMLVEGEPQVIIAVTREHSGGSLSIFD